MILLTCFVDSIIILNCILLLPSLARTGNYFYPQGRRITKIWASRCKDHRGVDVAVDMFQNMFWAYIYISSIFSLFSHSFISYARSLRSYVPAPFLDAHFRWHLFLLLLLDLQISRLTLVAMCSRDLHVLSPKSYPISRILHPTLVRWIRRDGLRPATRGFLAFDSFLLLGVRPNSSFP